MSQGSEPKLIDLKKGLRDTSLVTRVLAPCLTLLERMLGINGVFVSFNIGPAFSDVIDGLIIVDLCMSDPKLTPCYLGKEGYVDSMEYNGFDTTLNEPEVRV